MAFAPLDGPRGAEWLHGRVHVGRMPFAPTRTPKNEPGFTPKTVLEPETWAVFACVSVWGRMVCTPTEIKTTRGWAFRRGTEIKTTRGWAFCRGTEIKTTRGWAFRRGTEIKTTRGWAFRRGTEIRTTRGWAFCRGTEIRTTRGWDLRRCTGGSKTPRPDPYGDAPASFLFERQVGLEACTVGVGELLQQRQLAPTADGAVLAA